MYRYFLAPFFWACIILFLSSIPSNDLPRITFWDFIKFDKVGHVVMYAVFSFQIMKACLRQHSSWMLRSNATKITLIVSIIYGALIEIFQEVFLADRSGDWLDVAANALGTIFGVLVFRMLFSEYIR